MKTAWCGWCNKYTSWLKSMVFTRETWHCKECCREM